MGGALHKPEQDMTQRTDGRRGHSGHSILQDLHDFIRDKTLKYPGQSTGQDTNWSNHLLAKPVKESIQMFFPLVLGCL